MTPLKVVYKYRPCGRLGRWHMWLARHDLQPPGFLAKFLGRLLYVLLWTVIYATIIIGGMLAPTWEY